MKALVAIPAMFAALFSAPAMAQDCFPLCRKGFVCREGQCVVETQPSAAPAKAAPAPKPVAVAASEPLDRESIHSDYNGGDFEAVASALESFMARNKTYAHDDSVFIAKHLSVVYSANPAMREKGKYYMYRLLDLVPSAKLVDMYVSDEIDRIFEKIREEYYVRKGVSVPEKTAFKPVRPSAVAAAEPAEEGSDAIPQPPTAQAPKSSSTWKILAWTGAGVAVVGAGTAAYFLMQEEPNPRTFIVNARTQAP